MFQKPDMTASVLYLLLIIRRAESPERASSDQISTDLPWQKLCFWHYDLAKEPFIRIVLSKENGT
jgi:hypothetical protein